MCYTLEYHAERTLGPSLLGGIWVKKRAALIAVGSIASLTAAPSSSGASPAPTRQAEPAAEGKNCIAQARPIAEKVTNTEPLVCFGTYAEVLEAFGLTDVDPDVTPATVTRGEARQLSRPVSRSFPYRALATHYSAIAPTGDSLTISGTNCDGGGVTLDGSNSFINNRVRETRHYACGKIKHYATQNYTGDFQMTEAPRGYDRTINSVFRNDVSSISYHDPEQ